MKEFEPRFNIGDRVLVNTYVKQKGTIIEFVNDLYKVKLDNTYRWHYLFEGGGYKDVDYVDCSDEDMELINE